MARKLAFTLASVSLALVPSTANPASHSFNLSLQVPVHCVVQHHATGYGTVTGAAVSLGQFREFCNAPGGYELVMSYTPNTLRGTRIMAGADEIVLDGSGRAILSRAPGPRVRERALSAIPGEGGFDTDRLELQIIPI